MCLTFFYLNSQPNENKDNIKFAMIFNREELFKRDTLPVNYFQEDNNILAGKQINIIIKNSYIKNIAHPH